MKIEKVLIVVPPLTRFHEEGIDIKRPSFEIFRIVTPIEPLTAGAILEEEGYKVKLFDMGLYRHHRYEKLAKKVNEYKPDMVVLMPAIITFLTSQDWDGKEVFDMIKSINPNIKTVLTGGYPTNYPQEASKVADYIIKGESDFAITDLCNFLSNKTANLPERYSKVDINKLPKPAFHLIDENQYFKLPEYAKTRYPEKGKKWRDIVTSRGCPNRCPFCCIYHLRGKQHYRRKSIDRVIEEIKDALDAGIEEIHFFDDLFAANERQILEFCGALKKNNLKFPWLIAQGMHVRPLTYKSLKAMKETGMYRLICSFESASDRVLNELIHKGIKLEDHKNIIKWCNELDIELIGMFVIGMPGETRKELKETVKFAENPGLDYVVFSIVTPMVGSELEKTIKDNTLVNRIIKKTVALFHTNEFTEEDLGVIRAFDWNRINFSNKEKTNKYKKMFGLNDKEVRIIRNYSINSFYHYFPNYKGPKSIHDKK